MIGQKIQGEKAERARALRREMTYEERILWRHLRDSRVHGLRFRRQQVIDGFIVDFYGHSVGVVVEVDGGVHEEQAEYDAERDEILSARGLRIVRITNEEIRQDLPAVLGRISATCRSEA